MWKLKKFKKSFTLLELLLALMVSTIIFSGLFFFLAQFRNFAKQAFDKNLNKPVEQRLIERLSFQLPKALWAEKITAESKQSLVYFLPEKEDKWKPNSESIQLLQVKLTFKKNSYLWERTLVEWNMQDFITGKIQSMKPLHKSTEIWEKNTNQTSSFLWDLQRRGKKNYLYATLQKKPILIPVGAYQK